MAVLRPHLALTVSDVERAIPFYEALFGSAPEKVKPELTSPRDTNYVIRVGSPRTQGALKANDLR